MFKTLSTVNKTNRFSSIKYIARRFSHCSDNGEYKFLDRYNYVGNRGIYWTHPQSSFIFRVTDDYDQCRLGNRCSDNTCWWYFPKMVVSMLKNDFSEQVVFDIENELRQWKFLRTTSKKYFDWGVTLGRCYASFPQVSSEQKVFGAKQYVAGFYLDDVIEKLSSNREFNSAADELLNNLWLVYSDKFEQITDMNKFKGQVNMPDIYIDNAIHSIESQKEIMQLGKQVLKPKIYDFFVLANHHYLVGVTAEKALFQKHYPSQTVISEREGKFARHRSVGFRWVLPVMMTDETTPIHLNFQNPAVDLGVEISTFDNDLIGCFRDKTVEYSPMTFLKSSSSEESDLDVARNLANRSNEMKEAFACVCDNVPAESFKHYEHLAKYVGYLIDFCFVTRLHHNNNRYGWIPQLD